MGFVMVWNSPWKLPTRSDRTLLNAASDHCCATAVGHGFMWPHVQLLVCRTWGHGNPMSNQWTVQNFGSFEGQF